eukprot:jgi/Mesvir1/14879/Mv05488-RA.1
MVVGKVQDDVMQEGLVVVSSGDTLWSLSQRLGVSCEQLQEVNKLQDASTLFPGRVLKVPVHQEIVEVKEGDSLWEISRRMGVSEEVIQAANKLENPNSLMIGDKLRVPIPTKASKLKPVGVPPGRLKHPMSQGASTVANFFQFSTTKNVDDYREAHRDLLDALRMVETSFQMPAPDGDDGLSIGPLQISSGYHEDAWTVGDRWEENHDYDKCRDVDHAERTVVRYWLRYCPWALEFGDRETLARMHNGGPQFWQTPKTHRYWRKVNGTMNPWAVRKNLMDDTVPGRSYIPIWQRPLDLVSTVSHIMGRPTEEGNGEGSGGRVGAGGSEDKSRDKGESASKDAAGSSSGANGQATKEEGAASTRVGEYVLFTEDRNGNKNGKRGRGFWGRK